VKSSKGIKNNKSAIATKTGASKKVFAAEDTAVLKDRYVIHCNNPIMGLDNPSSKAFEVVDNKSSVRKLFAYVSRVKVLPRLGVSNALRGFVNKGMLPYVASGYVDWPAEGERAFAVVYERPIGGKVMPNLKDKINPLEEKELITAIKPLVGALKEFSKRGICHRSIRPDNLFYMDKERTHIVFGDCIAVSPAYEQPASCETIPSMMCSPIGRGVGSYANDMYSFGATILMLALGFDPVANLSDEKLLEMKVKKGSYSTLIGDGKVSLSVMEALRGLLVDDADQRWDIESLELWVNGRRMSPVQSTALQVAQRALHFNGKEYYELSNVSKALYKNWEAAKEIILNGKLEIWLRRGFEDSSLADGLARIVDSISIRVLNKKNQGDIAVASVCMYLDKGMPVRYKGLSFMPDGFSDALYRTMAKGQNTKDYIDVIKYGLIEDWCDFNDMKTLIPVFLPIKKYINSTKMGYGLERCLYELNEKVPCLSKLVENSFVYEVKELLPALDEASKRQDSDAWPVDRHIAAFVASKVPKKVSEQVEAMNSSDPAVAAAGMVSLLATLQWSYGPETVFGLVSWVGGLVSPIVSSYHSKTRKKQIEKTIPRIVRSGKIYELYSLIDNVDERNADARDFDEAKAEYVSSKKEILKLEGGKKTRDKEAVVFGHQVAAVTSVIIAIMSMILLFLFRLV
jgi:serine/threonine protein kinase